MRCRRIFTIIFCCNFFFGYSCIAQLTFQKTYGGSINDGAYSVQQTTDRGYILTGYTNSYGTGNDIYLIKTDSAGNVSWTKTFGVSGPGNDRGNFVLQTPDGGYVVAGQALIGTFILKTDASGNLIWAKRYPAAGDSWANCIRQTSDGGYVITGAYQDVNIFNSDFDFFISKVDSSGNLLWSKMYSGIVNQLDWAFSVQQTPDGGYIAVGWTNSFASGTTLLIKTDGNGNLLWARTYSALNGVACESVIVTNDGNYIISGRAALSTYHNKTYLLKVDISGNPLWSKIYGDTTISYSNYIEQTTDGGYVLVGERQQDNVSSITDALLIKTDSSGNLQWVKAFGGAAVESGTSVKQTQDGGYAVAGYAGMGTGLADIYLVKTDSTGKSYCYEDDITFTDSTIATIGTFVSLLDTAVGVATAFAPVVNSGATVTPLCFSLGEDIVSFDGENEVNIYPNPASNKVVVKRHQFSGNNTIIIYNLFGEEVVRSEIKNSESEINIKNFTSGIYFLMLTDSNKRRVMKKFVKM